MEKELKIYKVITRWSGIEETIVLAPDEDTAAEMVEWHDAVDLTRDLDIEVDVEELKEIDPSAVQLEWEPGCLPGEEEEE